jgi:hypothetical protein
MVMSFGTWNVRSLNNSGSLRRVAWELRVYKLVIVGYRDLGGTQGAHKDLEIIIVSIEKKIS